MEKKISNFKSGLCGILMGTSMFITGCSNLNFTNSSESEPNYSQSQISTQGVVYSQDTQNNNSEVKPKEVEEILKPKEKVLEKILSDDDISTRVKLLQADEKSFEDESVVGEEITEIVNKYSRFSSYGLSPEFFKRVEQIGEKYSINPTYILKVIEKESRFNTKATNSASGAVGLIQFTRGTAQRLGTTREQILNMDVYQQLEFVDKYFDLWAKSRVRPQNFGDMAMLIMWPRAVGRDDNYILYQRGDEAYSGNSPLDLDGNGVVTRGEAVKWYSRRG